MKSSISKDIYRALESIAGGYPTSVIKAHLADIPRTAFHISLVLEKNERDCSLCDLGGGTGFFAIGCAALGMRTVVVDDFNDPGNIVYGQGPQHLQKKYGVEVLCQDLTGTPLTFAPGVFDVVTSFDSMEHWHHSPKRLFREVMRILKPSGVFILGVPNCVNLRKRITVPIGFGKWSSMEDWYDRETFRGHVREPAIDDLRYIADDMGLQRVRTFGRNWMAYYRLSGVPAAIVDHILRRFPSLCSDIYLVGEKAED